MSPRTPSGRAVAADGRARALTADEEGVASTARWQPQLPSGRQNSLPAAVEELSTAKMLRLLAGEETMVAVAEVDAIRQQELFDVDGFNFEDEDDSEAPPAQPTVCKEANGDQNRQPWCDVMRGERGCAAAGRPECWTHSELGGRVERAAADELADLQLPPQHARKPLPLA
jgi:hypothetical protein